MKLSKPNRASIGRLLLAPAWLLAFAEAAPLAAGAFIFAGEANGHGIIAHPAGYSGSGGTVEVSVCIDPASANVAELAIPVRNAIATFNAFTASTGNLSFPGSDPSGSQFDIESAVVHEIGHCIGLAHPNLGALMGLTSAQTDFTNATPGVDTTRTLDDGVDNVIGSSDDSRGDDVNLHWFRIADNNPFLLGATVDATTYSRDPGDLPGGHTFPANASRDVGTLLGFASTEAVMQQGQSNGEVQRQLTPDDVATLRFGMSGVDESQGTADDYTIVLVYAGVTDSCDIVASVESFGGFAACSVSGIGIGGSHVAITSATASFDSTVNWYFNDVPIEPEIFEDGFESGNTTSWSSTVP